MVTEWRYYVELELIFSLKIEREFNCQMESTTQPIKLRLQLAVKSRNTYVLLTSLTKLKNNIISELNQLFEKFLH